MLTQNSVLQNRYLIINQVGRGGMGAVYLALDQRFAQSSKVAIKEILFNHERLSKAFEQEAWLLNQLRHPALPRVTDYFSEGNSQFLVMEFVPGEDLWQMMNRGVYFPVDAVLHWADQLLDALDYLHTQQPAIVHRDIKPHNIKLMETGRVMLIDFGAAKGSVGFDSNSSISSMSVVGFTPNYAPIEQSLRTDEATCQTLGFINQAKLDAILKNVTDPRSDIYSLAATLYHLLTRKIPIAATTRLVAQWMGNADPLELASKLNPEVPVAVAEVLRDALSLEPGNRLQTAKQMRAALHFARTSKTATQAPNLQHHSAVTESAQKHQTLNSEPPKTLEPQQQRAPLNSAPYPSQPVQEQPPLVSKAAGESAAYNETMRLDMYPLQSQPSNQQPRQPSIDPNVPKVPTLHSNQPPVPLTHSRSPQAQFPPPQQGYSQPLQANSQSPQLHSQGAVALNSQASKPIIQNSNRKLITRVASAVVAGIILSVAFVFIALVIYKKTEQQPEQPAVSSKIDPPTKLDTTTPVTPEAPEGMVYVKGGDLMMGRDDGVEYEKPMRPVVVESFFIDKTEVTREEYAKCVAANKCTQPEGWTGNAFPQGTGRFPVTGVNWDQANDYAKFAGKRLPTEKEWEFAARGTQGFLYPWGNEWEKGKANADGEGKTFTEVGASSGKSPFGLADMSGNAWEWTADSFKLYSNEKLPDELGEGDFRVIRGGSWNLDKAKVTTTYRNPWPARKIGDYKTIDMSKVNYANTSFRCVKDVKN